MCLNTAHGWDLDFMKPSCHDPQGIANLIEQGSKRADKLHQPEVDRSHVCGMHCFFLFRFLMFREKNIKTLKATLPETNSKTANAVKRIDGWKLENQSFSFRLSALFSGVFWLIASPFPRRFLGESTPLRVASWMFWDTQNRPVPCSPTKKTDSIHGRKKSWTNNIITPHVQSSILV